jgi:hypothetical protein
MSVRLSPDAVDHLIAFSLYTVVGPGQALYAYIIGQAGDGQHPRQFCGGFRPGVKQGGYEHIAGHAADRIEVYMHDEPMNTVSLISK